MINLHHSLKALYNIQVFSRNGVFLRETGFFPNLLLDQLFETYFGGSTLTAKQAFQYCKVGSNNTPPANTDTTVTTVGSRFSYVGSDPAESMIVSGSDLICTTMYESLVGQTAGSIAEVAIESSASLLMSRTLIKTPGGVPTSLTIFADEYTRVQYKIVHTVPLADQTGGFTIAGIPYTYTARPCNWTSGLTGAPRNSTNPFAFPNDANSSAGNGFGFNYLQVGDSQSLAAVTSAPAYGSSYTQTSGVAAEPYVANSKQRTITYQIPGSSGNIAGGIGGARIYNNLSGAGFQISFSPKIPKVNPKVFKLSVTHTFAR